MKTQTFLFLLRRFLFFIVVGAILAMVAYQAFMQKKDVPRTLADLTPGEYVYVERMVLLERAKSVALVDRTAGEAVLDSLAAAWGDSSFEKTLVGAPSQPERSAAVAELLRRVITVEQESLKTNPGLDRLALPLPAPAVEEPEPETAEDPET